MPTPPHSRQYTQLPTPETVRYPRKTDKSTLNRSRPVHEQPSSTFLPTPQTLPRQRKSFKSGDEPVSPPSPSGQTTFIHAQSSSAIVERERGPRRRPGLTFAQQMGLLSTSGGSGAFGGRLGVGVGMGGGHKNASGHRGVDLIAPIDKGPAQEENPFYVAPSEVKKVKASPKAVKTMMRRKVDMEDSETEDDMAGPSSPLAGRSPALASPANLTIPPQPKFRHSPRSKQPIFAPSTPPAQTSSSLPRPPAFASPAPRRSPRQLAKAAQIAAMRDEEHNPFLAKPGEVHRPVRRTDGLDDEADRPYVTYVFRGTKKVFANPFLRPDYPFPQAMLDPEHEDFEEHPCPPPRLLWPTAPTPTKKPVASTSTAIAATPSPPSSPVMRTPKTNRIKRGRFGNADRSLTEEMFAPPAEVYTDSEEERERVHRTGSSTVRKKERATRRPERVSDSEEEEDVPVVRRGLLFPAAVPTVSGKRAGEETHEGGRGKKARTLRV